MLIVASTFTATIGLLKLRASQLWFLPQETPLFLCLDCWKGRTSGFQKSIAHLRDSFLYLVAMGNVAPLNDKAAAFHQVSAALKLLLPALLWPFLAFWKTTPACLHGFLMSKALFTLQLAIALPSIEPAESPGNTVKKKFFLKVPGFTSAIQYEDADLPKKQE